MQPDLCGTSRNHWPVDRVGGGSFPGVHVVAHTAAACGLGQGDSCGIESLYPTCTTTHNQNFRVLLGIGNTPYP